MSKLSDRQLIANLWHGYVKKHALKLVIVVFFMLIEGGATYLFVSKLGPLVDEVFTAGDGSQIWPIAIAIAGIFLLRGVSSFIHRTLISRTGLLIVGDLQKNLTQHLLTLDMEFFNRHSPGELIERVRGDTQGLQSFATNTLLTLGRDTAVLVGMLAAAIKVDLMWTITIFIGLPLLILPIGLLQKVIRKQSSKARETSASLSTRLDEIFHGIKAVRLFSLENHENQRFSDTVQRFIRTTFNSDLSRAAMPSIIDVFGGLGFAVVVIYGSQEIMSGEKTTGDFLQFFSAIMLTLDPIRRLTNVAAAVQGALANLERIFYLFGQQPKARPNAEGRICDAGADIRFENVHFSYGENPVLSDLSFIAPGGKTTAFVGPSGAGKSTLFNVLTQLELQQSGEIFIGEAAVSTTNLHNLRKNIAVVSQESALFDESIRDNIWLGDLSQDQSQVEQAAKLALVNEFAEHLPDGLDSLAGPRGTNLSGGQRQRVIIARALLSNAPILLLDEATSALDNQTEQKIQTLLDEFTQDKTTLVIAHRLTTVMNADLIHVMKEGRIVESGTHAELLAKGEHYAQLHTQLEQ